MRHIIVGTAGHIDHGKTALVKALTGIDADRLKEEKQRGITIDIGFADLAVDDVRFGFVDVPGHERFVKNMLAGAHGLDLVMLVVAADESIMPQTREHFDICRLLKVKAGLVVLTKSDLVEEDLLELARAEVEDFVKGSFLDNSPVIAVSSRTGAGIEQLKEALVELARGTAPKITTAVTRLPVDRSFSVKGFGTVVTGTLIAGELRVGDEVEVLPSSRRARVRNLQVHGRDIPVACAGQRTAVNLQGLNLEQVARGTVIATAGRLRPSSMIDARLELLRAAPKPLGQRARVRLHHGTAEVMARVVLLGEAESYLEHSSGRDQLMPGESRLVQLRLEQSLTVVPGDRLIIRSYSPQLTIGGGAVIDVFPEKHGIRDSMVLARLKELERSSGAERAAILVEMAGPRGLSVSEFAARTGATDAEIRALSAELSESGRAIKIAGSPEILISSSHFDTLSARLLELLAQHHLRDPLALGLSREEARERAFRDLPAEIFRSVISRLVERDIIAAERDTLRLSAHRPELTLDDMASKMNLEEAFKSAGLQASTLEEAAAAVDIPVSLARKLYNLLDVEHKIVRIGDFCFHAETIDGLISRLRVQKVKNSRIDVAVFKELTGGLTRKHAIPLLEYLDRERITKRIGNEREIL